MKILHILDMSIPGLKGYSVRSQGIVEAQSKIGISPVVVTSFRQQNYTGKKEIINNISYYRSGTFSPKIRLPFWGELLEVKAFSQQIENVVKEEQVDVLHAHSPILCGMAAKIVAKKFSLPIVYEIRAFWEDAAVSSGKCKANSLRYRLTRAFETNLCKRVDKVVTICEGLRDDLIGRGINNGKIEVVPNGVDLDCFKELPKSKDLLRKYRLDGCIVLGFIGSFFKFEGVELLVPLMEEFRDKFVKMVLVGDGETYEKVKRLIRGLGLEKQVVVTGRVPHEEINNYYSIIDILIYPRLSERITELTTPLKPLETMAMKKNIVISDVGGLKELVPEGCGEIFTPGDVADLKRKIGRLLGDEKTRKQHVVNAYKFVLERDWKQIVGHYKKIYRELIEADGIQ